VSAANLTWTLREYDTTALAIVAALPVGVDAQWAFGGARGAGVRVAVLDSGITPGHPMVGTVQASYAIDGDNVIETEAGDVYGHGTACASIIRGIAPDCELNSVNVLGVGGAGSGLALLTGLSWAIRQRFDTINLSLSTTRTRFDAALRTLADEAFFQGTVLVCSAHNTPVESFPWRYSSVISVGSHQVDDSSLVLANPAPPVEFFARGQAVEVAALGGGVTRNTGNSFATPHITGRCAAILSNHPGLTPFQVKTALYATSANVGGAR
jgi:subtilisin